MKPTTRNTYANTDKQKVLNFVQSLAPTPAEAPYLACILKKSGLSMRDARLLLEYVARRASEHPLERDACGFREIGAAISRDRGRLFHGIAGSHFAVAGRLIDGFMGSGVRAKVKGFRGFAAHAFA